MNEYEKAFNRILRNKYNSNIKLVCDEYSCEEVRTITKKGRLQKKRDIELIKLLIEREN